MITSFTTSAIIGVLRLLLAEVVKRAIRGVLLFRGIANDGFAKKHPIRSEAIIFS